MHANDNAREGRPGVWIFQGRSVVLLVIGAGLFVGLFRILDFAGIDLPLNFALSLLPLAMRRSTYGGLLTTSPLAMRKIFSRGIFSVSGSGST